MPLHLLSKKSWNVYAPANRARVARDEALAEAARRDAERDHRDQKSASTIEALRQDTAGRKPREISDQDKLMLKATKDLKPSRDDISSGRKRKRLPGEDDTDRDLRFAREQQDRRSEHAIARLRSDRNEDADAPMIDAKGHINLFPEHKSRNGKPRKKSEVDREREHQRDAAEGQGMQLKDAWGHKDPKGAWYLDKDGSVKDAVGKDVWGNEDPRRFQRQAQRLTSSDPLAFMKKAQVQLKEGRKERVEREAELRRHRSREDRDLIDFSLDRTTRRSKSRPSRRDDYREASRDRSDRYRNPDHGRDQSSHHQSSHRDK